MYYKFLLRDNINMLPNNIKLPTLHNLCIVTITKGLIEKCLPIRCKNKLEYQIVTKVLHESKKSKDNRIFIQLLRRIILK